MAASDALRKIAKSPFTAVAGVALAASSPAMADEPAPYAQSHATVQPVAAQSIRIPVKDLRSNQIRGVQMMAAMASKDQQVLVYFGQSQSGFDAMYEGAQRAVAAGVPLAGIIVAQPHQMVQANGTAYKMDQVAFYADGIVTDQVNNPEAAADVPLADYVRDELLRGFNEVIVPKRHKVAMASPQARQ